MEKQKIDLYLTTNSKYFEASAIPVVRQKLENASDDALVALQATELKDPTMLGDTGMGILKLLTGGLCGILTIIDWFTVAKKAKELNLAKISMIV